MVINVIDYRQQYPQAMVKQALESLGFHKEADKLRHVSYGVVSLSPSAASDLGIDTSDGKASYAMSGRQGIGIKITELIHQVAKVIEDTRSDKTVCPVIRSQPPPSVTICFVLHCKPKWSSI